MMSANKYRFVFPLLVIAMAVFTACESNFKEVQKINFSEFVPSGEADGINLKYTDSGRITSILISPKMKEYASVDFPFTDFPKGIDVTLYDKRGKRTFIKSDYATSFKATNIIDLRGNVRINSDDGQTLLTDQLYFDQKNEWFFTEKQFTFTDSKGSSAGTGIDFSKDFKVINSQRISGEVQSAD